MAKADSTRPGPRGQAPPRPRGGGARTVAQLLPEVGGVAFRRFGFLQGALVGRWREVVGPVYARWSLPQSIRFPRGERTGGTLTVRVEGPFAVQLQHVGPQILDRANRILGPGTVVKLRLVQGEVAPPAERMPAPAAPVVAPAGNVVAVRDNALRAALESLAEGLAAAPADGPRLPRIR